jgi:uncharacterized protein (TIGR02001 family)
MCKHPAVTAAALAASLICVPAAQAGEDATPFSANIAIASDYTSRGMSQTDERPALQGGLDYAHPSGFYAGVWGSNISWLRDAETSEHSGNSLELDIYGGYTRRFGDFGIDAGVLRFQYPGKFGRAWKNDTGLENPNTTEGYVGVSWKFLKFKFSHAFTRLLGFHGSRGSEYYDLSASHEIAGNLTLQAHFGHQRFKGHDFDSYNDWKLGMVYRHAGLDFGLHYVDTSLKHADELNADSRVIFSIGKTF